MTFKEEQRFNAPWLMILLALVGFASIVPIWMIFYKQILKGEPPGPDGMSDLGLILLFFGILAIYGGIVGLIYYCKLITYIDEKNIVYRFIPFHRKAHSIPWDEVESAEVVKYRPIMEYGGWGIRYGRKGKAYNTKGNKGLEIITKDGKNLLIGTQEPEQLRIFMTNINNLRR
ncbi:MAG: hypothetical protein HKN68_04915 [Saprospiraceae bacterium]|nr:hypothetical protein [Saprospiraceae bacterium]